MKRKDIRNTCLSIIKNLENDKSYQEYAKKFENDELKYFKKRFEDKSFKLAVIGEFSSGKSTFINAIIHKDLLAHGKRETTATLTYLINVPSNDKRINSSIVYFSKDGGSKTFSNLDDLKEYTTVNDKRQVVGEIEKVEVFLNFADNKKDFIIIDSPGLNGVAQGHFEKTLEIIKSADACVYIFPLQGIRDSDLNYLRTILKYQNNFIFVHNFIDELKESEGETKETKLNSLKENIEELLLKGNDSINYRICGVSALKELVYYDKRIKRLYNTDKVDLTANNRKLLHQESGFEDYYDILRTDYSDADLDIIKYMSSAFALKEYLEELKEKCGIYSEKVKETKEYKNEKDNQDSVRKDIEKLKNGRNNQKKKLENLIISGLKETEEECLDDLNNKLNSCIEIKKTKINKLNTEECIDLYSTLGNELYFDFCEIIKSSNDLFKAYITNLSWKIKDRIEKYSGVTDIEFSNADEKAFTNDVMRKTFDSELKGIEDDINTLETEVSEFSQIRDNDLSLLKEKKDGISIKEDAIESLNDDENYQIKKLGLRPSGESKTIVVGKRTIRREGFFGWLTDSICGVQEKVITKSYYDDSKGKNWDYQKNKIKQNYDVRRREYQDEIEDLKDEIESLEKIINRNITNVDKAKQKLKEKEEEYEKRKKYEKEYERKIALDYLVDLRKRLIEQMNEYKEERFKEFKTELINIINKKIKADLKIEAFKRFDKALDDFINILKVDSKKSDLELESLIGIYNNLSVVLDDYIKDIGEICND